MMFKVYSGGRWYRQAGGGGLFSADGVYSGGGNVFSGYLMDRIPPRYLLSVIQGIKSGVMGSAFGPLFLASSI